MKLGLLLPEQGAAGLWAVSAQACADLAVGEVNMMGGVLGRSVSLTLIDAGPSAYTAAEAARDAIELDGIEAIIGMFPSYARLAVVRAIDGRVPLVYTPQFEGLESGTDVMTTGETSTELMAPALAWLTEERRAKRFFLCGSDYLWPRVSFGIAKRLLRELGAVVVGECYTPLDQQDYGELLDTIRTANADVVLPHFLGQEAILFNRAFAEAGLTTRSMRFASAIDETVIYGLGAEATENLFVTSAYFAAAPTANNLAFLERYHARHGGNPPPSNAYGQSCYEGLHGFAALAERAGGLDARRMRRALGRARQRKSGRGSEAMPLVGARHPIHLAQVDGHDIRILRTLS